MQYMNGWQMIEWGKWLAKQLCSEHRKYFLASHMERYPTTRTYYFVLLEGYHPEVRAWYVYDNKLKKYRWYDENGKPISEPEYIAQKKMKKW